MNKWIHYGAASCIAFYSRSFAPSVFVQRTFKKFQSSTVTNNFYEEAGGTNDISCCNQICYQLKKKKKLALRVWQSKQGENQD